jgi:integrase
MRAATYSKVFDERKRRVRGLWKRNGWFYARLTAVDAFTGQKSTRRIRLETARTVAEARNAMQDLHKDRRDEKLPVLKRSPRLADYWKKYFEFYDSAKDAKRASTLHREKSVRKNWLKHLGEIRLKEITRGHVNGYIAKRQAAGIKPRTVNRDVIGLRNLLNRAIDDGLLKSLPMENLHPLKVDHCQRALVTAEQMEKLHTAAAAVLPRSGELLSDVLRFMCASGARIAETLRLRWADVDFNKKQITIGADGLAKNRKPRVMDFSALLEKHLQDMSARRPQDSEWLFPSPRRGKKDVPLVNFNKALRSACAKAGFPKFGFHDCRHYFISHCVMSGVDFMTTARWVGHQDGGVLIGKIYGHLNDEHMQRQAQKLVLPATGTPDGTKKLPLKP